MSLMPTSAPAARALVTALMLATLPGCASTRQADFTAKQAVATYLDAERAGRYDEAWAMLAPTDRAAHPLEAYTADHNQAGVMWQEIAARTRFELKAVHDLDGHRIVEVLATRPDPEAVEQVMRGVSSEALARSEDPKALLRRHIRETLDRSEVPPDEETLFYAVTEGPDGTLRVWLGLDRQFAAIEHARRARVAMDAGDDAAARVAWEALLGVPEDPGGVVAMLAAEARTQLETMDARAAMVTATPVAEDPAPPVDEAPAAGPATEGAGAD